MKIEKIKRKKCYVIGDHKFKKFLTFKLNSVKRSIFTNEKEEVKKYLVQFPDMEFEIPYYIKGQKPILYYPYYEIKYVHNKKIYCPLLPNSTIHNRKVVFCTDAELYCYSFSFENLDDVKEFIINKFFNSPFYHTLYEYTSDNEHGVKIENISIKTNEYFKKWQELSKNGITDELLNFISSKI